MLISLALVVVAVTMVTLAAFMIPAFIEIRKTAVAIREMSARAENEFTPVLHELHTALAELKSFAESAATKTEELQSFMEVLGDTGRNLRSINNVLGTVAGALSSSTAWVVGAKVAGKLILDRLSRKRKEG
jgi:uncharacterized protein YoxC